MDLHVPEQLYYTLYIAEAQYLVTILYIHVFVCPMPIFKLIVSVIQFSSLKVDFWPFNLEYISYNFFIHCIKIHL